MLKSSAVPHEINISTACHPKSRCRASASGERSQASSDRKKPRSGGTPGFPKRTTIVLGGYVIVLLNRTARHGHQFRLHVPNQNDVSPRVSGSASRQTAWAPGSTGLRHGSTRIAEQTDGRLKKKRRWSSQHPTPRGGCSRRGPGSGRLTNQAHLHNRDRASTNRPFARERRAGVANDSWTLRVCCAKAGLSRTKWEHGDGRYLRVHDRRC